MSNIVPKTDHVKEFINLVMDAGEALVKAGEIAVKAMAEDPGFIDRVCDASPLWTPEAVRVFIAIGQRKMAPELWGNFAPGARRLVKCPIEVQKKYLSESLPLLLEGGEVLMVELNNLTSDQAEQVFDGQGSIRSEAAQRAFRESKKAKQIEAKTAASGPSDGSYKMVGKNRVQIIGEPTLDRAELLKILTMLQ